MEDDFVMSRNVKKNICCYILDYRKIENWYDLNEDSVKIWILE